MHQRYMININTAYRELLSIPAVLAYEIPDDVFLLALDSTMIVGKRAALRILSLTTTLTVTLTINAITTNAKHTFQNVRAGLRLAFTYYICFR